MNRWIAAVTCAGAVAAAGCAVQGRSFERASTPPGDAVIYVYRPYHYAASLLEPPVTCGDETARIGPGGYHAFVAPAGKVICSVPGETSDEVEIDADPRVHYIREEFGWGVWSGHPHLNPVDSDTAQSEIQKCCVQQAALPGP
jgi:hypothetical protein